MPGWNLLSTRVVVIISSVAHLGLVLCAEVRRNSATGFRIVILWVANQMSRWAPTTALAMLAAGRTPQEEQLVTLWVAFMLLHAGMPDNITAYALEDGVLSFRQSVNVFLQLVGPVSPAYILHQNMFAMPGDSMLWVSSIICCMAICKYLEGAFFALQRGNLENMRSESKKEVPSRRVTSLQSLRRGGKPDNDQIMLVAHGNLHITKGAFIDNLQYEHDAQQQEILPKTWDENKTLYKVVEMELSLMYDILYTKAAMVHTWGGYAIRVAFPFAGATAFLLFWFHSKEGQLTADVFITYILLAGTVILDIIWLLKAVASTWTYSFLNDRPRIWLHHALLCSGKWRLLRRLIVSLNLFRFLLSKEPTSYRMWSGTMGQYNILHECTSNDQDQTKTFLLTRIFISILVKIVPEDNCMEFQYHYLKGFRMSSDFCKHLFESIWEYHKSAYPPTVPIKKADEAKPDAPPVPYPDKKKVAPAPTPPLPPKEAHLHQRELEDALNFSPAFQESILIWHIATDVFLLYSHQYSSSCKEVQAIKVLSDYMVFLVAVRPNMLPGLKLRSLYEAVGYALTNDDEILPKEEYHGNLTEKKVKLAHRLVEMEQKPSLKNTLRSKWRPGVSGHWFRPENASILYDKNIILSDGTSFARVLLSRIGPNPYTPDDINLNYTRYQRLIDMIPELKDESNRFDTSKMMRLIFRAWVRLLVYASVRCTRDSHAKQLACGGELTTIVWILNEHAGIFRIDSDKDDDKDRLTSLYTNEDRLYL